MKIMGGLPIKKRPHEVNFIGPIHILVYKVLLNTIVSKIVKLNKLYQSFFLI